MQTQSGRQYNVNPTSPQQQESMEELLNQFRLLNNRMDMVLKHVFDKPESSGEKKHNEGEVEDEDRKEKSTMI